MSIKYEHIESVAIKISNLFTIDEDNDFEIQIKYHDIYHESYKISPTWRDTGNYRGEYYKSIIYEAIEAYMKTLWMNIFDKNWKRQGRLFRLSM